MVCIFLLFPVFICTKISYQISSKKFFIMEYTIPFFLKKMKINLKFYFNN